MPSQTPNPALTAKLQHLHAAAIHLAPNCPSISSHIGTELNRVVFDEASGRENLYQQHRLEICGACGSILDPGLSCHVRTERVDSTGRPLQRAKRKPGKKGRLAVELDTGDDSHARGGKVVVYRCTRCQAETRQALPPQTANRAAIAGRLAALKAEQDGQGKSTTTATTGSTATITANAGSRKRAKTRKQTGLQAMLSKSREDARTAAAERNSSASGFDLMDFMKSG